MSAALTAVHSPPARRQTPRGTPTWLPSTRCPRLGGLRPRSDRRRAARSSTARQRQCLSRDRGGKHRAKAVSQPRRRWKAQGEGSVMVWFQNLFFLSHLRVPLPVRAGEELRVEAGDLRPCRSPSDSRTVVNSAGDWPTFGKLGNTAVFTALNTRVCFVLCLVLPIQTSTNRPCLPRQLSIGLLSRRL